MPLVRCAAFGRDARAPRPAVVGAEPPRAWPRDVEIQRVAERTGRVVVDHRALGANFRTARALAGGREVIAVVKADGYGHGASAVARTLLREGCPRLAVFDVHEACALREDGISVPVLAMAGAHDAGQAHLATSFGIAVVVHDRGALQPLREAARRTGHRSMVQVEVDTGMRRLGVPVGGAADLIAEIAADPDLTLEGVYTHFACADDAQPDSALDQIRAFRAVLGQLRERGVPTGLVHAANSAALLADPRIQDALPEATAVRPGLLLYGARSAAHQDPDRQLLPVMSVRTRVVAVRDVAAGTAVGYGASFRAPGPTRIATLPIGYADGVLRVLGGRGAVWLAGAVRPIVGRVSMDSVTVDCGDASVGLGDEAIFVGLPDGRSAASALHPVAGFGPGPGIAVEDQAAVAGTLAYELFVRFGERLPRRHVNADTTSPPAV